MEEPKINQEDVPIHPSNGGPPSRYVGGGVCAKCGALRGYWAYEGDPDCRSCNDQGELPFDLNKKFDHPWWGEEDVTFWNSFMGFDTVADPKRTWQDPRSTECHQKNKLRHFLRHGCCPGCHKYAEQFQEGQAVDRGLNYHFERGECYQWGLIREPGCKKCGADKSEARICPWCENKGHYEGILAKEYDHPLYSDQNKEFFNTFFGYDVNLERERYVQEDPKKVDQCCLRVELQHIKNHHCCPQCHQIANQWKSGDDVRRLISRHFKDDQCPNTPLLSSQEK